jgi:hypothetical protein
MVFYFRFSIRVSSIPIGPNRKNKNKIPPCWNTKKSNRKTKIKYSPVGILNNLIEKQK